MSFQKTFDINYYHYRYCAFIDCGKKKLFTLFRQIELIKISQNSRKSHIFV